MNLRGTNMHHAFPLNSQRVFLTAPAHNFYLWLCNKLFIFVSFKYLCKECTAFREPAKPFQVIISGIKSNSHGFRQSEKNKAMMKANSSVSEDARREQQQPTKANQTRECAHFLFLSLIKASSSEDVNCP